MVELRKLSQASLATVSNTVCFHIWPKCWSCRCWEEAKRFFSPEAPAVSAMVEYDVAGESGGGGGQLRDRSGGARGRGRGSGDAAPGYAHCEQGKALFKGLAEEVHINEKFGRCRVLDVLQRDAGQRERTDDQEGPALGDDGVQTASLLRGGLGETQDVVVIGLRGLGEGAGQVLPGDLGREPESGGASTPRARWSQQRAGPQRRHCQLPQDCGSRGR